MMLKHEIRDDTLTIFVETPRLDLQIGGKFKQEVAPLLIAPVKHVVLDLRSVEYIDSYGLGGLIFVLNKTKHNNQTLHLQHIGPGIKFILEITHLSTLFPLRSPVKEPGIFKA